MNRAKSESFTKFKRCLFLVVFLLSLINISGQSSENYLPYMIYNIKCNTYNALYYGRENEITIKYDTARNPGDIVLNFDTAFFKNVVRVNKYKYTFFLDDNEEFEKNNLIRDKSLHAYN